MTNGIPPRAPGPYRVALHAEVDWSKYTEDVEEGGSVVGESPFHLSRSESAPNEYVVSNQRLYYGRSVLTADDATVRFPEGSYMYALVELVGDGSGGSARRLALKLAVVSAPDDELVSFQSKFMLYHRKDDGEIVDFRFTPVIVAMD